MITSLQTMLRNKFAEVAESLEARGKEWNQMSLIQKWQVSVHTNKYQRDAVRAAHRSATAFYLYLSISTYYVTMVYTGEFYFGHYGPSILYYLKVLATFIFINCMANWLCTKFYTTAYHKSRDRPELQKKLWDDHPIEITTAEKNGLASAAQNGQVKYASEKKKLPWKPCVICQHDAPPRAHHCRVCNECILKRDHHCFLLGTCVGFYNQRYFVVLSFYMIIACSSAYFLIFKYMSQHFFPTADIYDCLLPFTIWRWLFGPIPFHHMLMVTHLYFLWFGAFLGLGFFIWQMFVIAIGKTTHETFHPAVKVKSTTSISENFRSVFGAFWPVNFIFPAVILFRQSDDGTQWDNVHTC